MPYFFRACLNFIETPVEDAQGSWRGKSGFAKTAFAPSNFNPRGLSKNQILFT
jgi:hypothetical protein